MNIVKTLWAYRDFILGSVKRDFQSKYQNSVLGSAWTFINPLAMIIVYTVIFSQVMSTKLPGVTHGFAYGIYLCAGSLTWGLFSDIIGRGLNIFIENANLIKKLNFPRLTLPVIAMFNASISFLITFSLFLAFLLLSGFWPGWPTLAFVPVLCIQLLFSIGLGMTLGVLNVFFRDVGQLFGIFMQFWFWFTPIVYPTSVLPEGVRKLIFINPMVPVITAYQDIFVLGKWPAWPWLVYPAVLGLLFCILGFCLFRRHSSDMVDEL